ncbi:hypothetical protein HUB92_00895 [Wolbachia endosymbiont of Wiebesia pumilae]|uniref:hypothetical protein n=1 Tax=Wolbachia endosymbiont of Wiebesia pumilae TaxID=2742717 RepID=UPI001AE710FE|nr:hypothetical protein [Wolbachia endosymbiont of Wiebesia pumilae]QTP61549.1 hypothetical protein HUB92_00895 [Wolbachia endosymbiont of Wiebesia pumilae]
MSCLYEFRKRSNESLQAQIIELKSRLKDKEDKLIELNQQWQASKLVALLKSQTDKLCQAKDKNTELENKVSDLGHENKALRLSVNTLTAQLGEMENLGKQLQSVQESKQQLERVYLSFVGMRIAINFYLIKIKS